MTDTDRPIRRGLAAILAADVVGYSRLAAQDEEGTARQLLERREVIDALIARSEGRIANTAGDSVIAEFSSSVEAVRCALDIQESVRTLNLGVPGDRQVQFRIGINVGDIIHQNGDILGDGVNVAARLEALAPAGGICLSGEVHDQVQGKLSLGFRAIGARRLKNIGRRVRAYQVTDSAPGARTGLRWPLVLGAAAAASAVTVAAVLFFGTGGAVSRSAGVIPAGADATLPTPGNAGEVIASADWNNTRYEAVLTWGGTWAEADADARRRGGHLISIGSEAENDAVYELIRRVPELWVMYRDGQAFGPWIGLYQEPGAPEPDGGWAWVDGTPVTWFNFAEGQPNNFGGASDVVRFYNTVHQPAPLWDDANGDGSAAGYVMERALPGN